MIVIPINYSVKPLNWIKFEFKIKIKTTPLNFTVGDKLYGSFGN